MKSKLVRRIAAFSSAVVLVTGAACMFSGCTSKHPQVTITYSFNGAEYAVEYELSRLSAPQTVQHFIELADAGYYDGTCIHDYDANYLYGGGYYFDESNELVEKNYFTEVRRLEQEGNEFTQFVWKNDSAHTPLYTVYGEFKENGCQPENPEYMHMRGALVMYYTDKSDTARGIEVRVNRNDGGDDNDGEETQVLSYDKNSATSLFYTFLGQTEYERDAKYTVFGKVVDLTAEGAFERLLAAIADYENELEEDASFTVENDVVLDYYDHEGDPDFVGVRSGGKHAQYNTPQDAPIIVTSVKVTKY